MQTSPPLILDQVMPRYDATRVDVRVVSVPAPLVFEAARDLDFLEISSPLVDAAMWLRSAPTTIAARFRGEDPPAPPTAMRLGNMFDHPEESTLEGWIGLGENPGREIVFGAVGAFWEADIPWVTIDPADFADYAEPGMAKLAASITAIPFGETRTLLTYEARTVGTDADATKRFMRYWRLVNGFVGFVMRAALRTIDEKAGSRAEAAASA